MYASVQNPRAIEKCSTVSSAPVGQLTVQAGQFHQLPGPTDPLLKAHSSPGTENSEGRWLGPSWRSEGVTASRVCKPEARLRRPVNKHGIMAIILGTALTPPSPRREASLPRGWRRTRPLKNSSGTASTPSEPPKTGRLSETRSRQTGLHRAMEESESESESEWQRCGGGRRRATHRHPGQA